MWPGGGAVGRCVDEGADSSSPDSVCSFTERSTSAPRGTGVFCQPRMPSAPQILVGASGGHETVVAEAQSRVRACCTAVRNDSFTYFQRHDGDPILFNRLESTFNSIMRDESTRYNTDRGQGAGSQEGEWDGRRYAPALRRVNAPPFDEHAAGRGIPLARELLAEIFQALDTVERVRKRRVCRLWDLLLAADAAKQLWIPCRRFAHKTRSKTPEQFLLACCLLKYATSATDTIILEDSSELSYMSHDVYGLVATLLQQRCIKLLLLSRHDFDDHDCDLHDYLDCINDQLTRFAATCQVVVWRECRLSLVQVSGKVAYAKFSLRDASAQRLTQLWDVLERSLVEKEVVDLSKLTEWIARCVSTRNRECAGILWVLNEFIGADPRTPQQGAYREWTVESLARLDVYQLPKVAQFVLHCRVDDS
ncbi:uncharacterized protein LOC129591002 [Paramacrobiotus metropolitanus]|uniref:uncharacterized protein LOC129591002 n=1 Tax=Paramacrobiotus metropolitanus TaxID=2943436 RepID=UPI00244588BA|nr:uncharacterized protein LOC129591002 [Paramacrobiotus metropolitanus]